MWEEDTEQKNSQSYPKGFSALLTQKKEDYNNPLKIIDVERKDPLRYRSVSDEEDDEASSIEEKPPAMRFLVSFGKFDSKSLIMKKRKVWVENLDSKMAKDKKEELLLSYRNSLLQSHFSLESFRSILYY